MKVDYRRNGYKQVTPANAKYNKSKVGRIEHVTNGVEYASSYRRMRDYINKINPVKHEESTESKNYIFDSTDCLFLPWCTFVLPDNSMSPTLNKSFHSIAWKNRKRKRVQRQSVVTVNVYDRKHKFKKMICRRIIGMPGDTVEIYSNGLITINGEHLREPYLKRNNYKAIPQTIKVPKNQYYVLGDNREDSWDSRNFGCIKYKQIGYVVTGGLAFNSSRFEDIYKLSKLTK